VRLCATAAPGTCCAPASADTFVHLRVDRTMRDRSVAHELRLGAVRRGVLPRRKAAPPHNAPFLRAVHHPKGDVMQLVNFVKSFVREEEGQDLLEYALLVALIALVAIAAVTAAGGSVKTIFQSIADQLGAAA